MENILNNNTNIHPTVSIIIRVKNEEKYLGQVLEALKRQTYQYFEIVIVNNHSTDKTLEIAKRYNCKIITSPTGKFTYPYACNFGARNSLGQYIIFLSGHSIPINSDWLKNGLSNFKDEKVAGVYSITLALPDANLLERFIYGFFGKFFQRKLVINKAKGVGMGVLGFTNAIIRKDLWEQYNINENFMSGGEDTEWGKHWVDKGFVLVRDPKFKVYHSHNLSLIGLIKQFIGWMKMGKETKFSAQKRNF